MDREGTKWKIFEVAVHLFAFHGIDGVSMKDIGEEANIRASSIYNHFKSKDALVAYIYDYFIEYIRKGHPDINQLLKDVETEHPHKVLWKIIYTFEPEDEDIMSKIMLIIASQVSIDARAEDAISETLIEPCYNYTGQLLRRMIELNKIEPVDIDSFSTLYASLTFYTANLFYSKRKIERSWFNKAITLLFQSIKVKE